MLAVVGSPDRSIAMSDWLVVIVAVAWLLPPAVVPPLYRWWRRSSR